MLPPSFMTLVVYHVLVTVVFLNLSFHSPLYFTYLLATYIQRSRRSARPHVIRPRCSMTTRPTALVVRVELPGVKPEDITLEVCSLCVCMYVWNFIQIPLFYHTDGPKRKHSPSARLLPCQERRCGRSSKEQSRFAGCQESNHVLIALIWAMSYLRHPHTYRC